MDWLVIVGWISGWLLLWRVPRLGRAELRQPAYRISIIIPARNEADRLPTLLQSLGSQTLQPHEVIVVDDHSLDGTRDVVQSFAGVKLLDAHALPGGWTGKSWSCATGASHVTGDLIVFLDADVCLAPEALERVVALWERSGGLVSVQPRHDPHRPVEALSLPFNVTAVMGLGIASIFPPSREWGVSGPCVVTDRHTYDDVGGHAAVRGSVAEDLALARRYSDAGHPVTCVVGGSQVRFRMYRNLRGIFEGWTKNIATGARSTPFLRTTGIVVWVAGLLTAAGFAASNVTDSASGAVAAAVVYTAVAVQVGVLGHQVGRFGPVALLWPVLLAFFVAVFVWSTLLSFGIGRVRWSGRSIALKRR